MLNEKTKSLFLRVNMAIKHNMQRFKIKIKAYKVLSLTCEMWFFILLGYKYFLTAEQPALFTPNQQIKTCLIAFIFAQKLVSNKCN